jgi:hypothetical protein
MADPLLDGLRASVPEVRIRRDPIVLPRLGGPGDRVYKIDGNPTWRLSVPKAADDVETLAAVIRTMTGLRDLFGPLLRLGSVIFDELTGRMRSSGATVDADAALGRIWFDRALLGGGGVDQSALAAEVWRFVEPILLRSEEHRAELGALIGVSEPADVFVRWWSDPATCPAFGDLLRSWLPR